MRPCEDDDDGLENFGQDRDGTASLQSTAIRHRDQRTA